MPGRRVTGVSSPLALPVRGLISAMRASHTVKIQGWTAWISRPWIHGGTHILARILLTTMCALLIVRLGGKTSFHPIRSLCLATWISFQPTLDGWPGISSWLVLAIKGILPPLTFLLTIQQDGYQALDVDIAPLKGHVWNVVDFGGRKPAQESLEGQSEALVGVRFQADWIVKHCQV